MKKPTFLIMLILFVLASSLQAQVGINTSGNPPDPSAMLDVSSNTGGFLFPRMTTAERDAISGPATGLTIFNTDAGCLEFFLGSVWQTVACGCTAAPGTPTAGTQVASASQVVWNWNGVSGVTGYKYNTTNDYNTATDVGNTTSYTQTGLTCGGTAYILYVWAYNACGQSSELTLNATTDVCPFVCGVSTVSHGYVSGVSPANTSPYNGTYTYPTASGDDYPALGTGKCWTALNIGAIGAPSSWNDNTGPHAGWHFQFNRKQGYYQGGSGVTPSWTVTNISENTTWNVSNDPCAQLFGTDWRLPTSFEWTNYLNASTGDGGLGGGDITVAFNSPLNIHAGGSLEPSNGNTNGRGSAGRYWTSEQNANNLAPYMAFFSGTALIQNDYKATGASVRCVKD